MLDHPCGRPAHGHCGQSGTGLWFTLQQIVTALATLLPKVSDTGQFFWRKLNPFVSAVSKEGRLRTALGSSHCGASQRSPSTQCDKYQTDCRPTLAHFSKLAAVDKWDTKQAAMAIVGRTMLPMGSRDPWKNFNV